MATNEEILRLVIKPVKLAADVTALEGAKHAHERGADRGRWNVPARPVMGITPQGWAQVIARHARFVRTLGEVPYDGDD